MVSLTKKTVDEMAARRQALGYDSLTKSEKYLVSWAIAEGMTDEEIIKKIKSGEWKVNLEGDLTPDQKMQALQKLQELRPQGTQGSTPAKGSPGPATPENLQNVIDAAFTGAGFEKPEQKKEAPWQLPPTTENMKNVVRDAMIRAGFDPNGDGKGVPARQPAPTLLGEAIPGLPNFTDKRVQDALNAELARGRAGRGYAGTILTMGEQNNPATRGNDLYGLGRIPSAAKSMGPITPNGLRPPRQELPFPPGGIRPSSPIGSAILNRTNAFPSPLAGVHNPPLRPEPPSLFGQTSSAIQSMVNPFSTILSRGFSALAPKRPYPW